MPVNYISGVIHCEGDDIDFMIDLDDPQASIYLNDIIEMLDEYIAAAPLDELID